MKLEYSKKDFLSEFVDLAKRAEIYSKLMQIVDSMDFPYEARVYTEVYTSNSAILSFAPHDRGNFTPEEIREIRKFLNASVLGVPLGGWKRVFSDEYGVFHWETAVNDPNGNQRVWIYIRGIEVANCRVEKYETTVTRFRSNCKPELMADEVPQLEGASNGE